MQQPEAYQRQLEHRLKQWRLKIDSLGKKHYDNAGAGVNFHRDVAEMLQKKEVMKERWKDLQDARDEQWGLRKNQLERASEDRNRPLTELQPISSRRHETTVRLYRRNS